MRTSASDQLHDGLEVKEVKEEVSRAKTEIKKQEERKEGAHLATRSMANDDDVLDAFAEPDNAG